VTAFLARLYELSEAINENRERHRAIPTLVLLFTAIDSLGALETGRATRQGFLSWVDEFLLGDAPAEWTALDLYAARCSILHTYTADSDLSEAGRAKRFMYAWGNAEIARLKIAAASVPGEWAYLHIDDIVARFHRAVTRVLDLMEVGDERSRRLLAGASRWYDAISTATLDGRSR